MTAHAGRLELPLLGLQPNVYAQLCNSADAIVHNGAAVSWVQSFEQLREVNVSATKALVQMASVRKLPLFFVSSISTTRLSGQQEFPEASLANFPPDMTTDGYIATKWASEVMLERAASSLGIPAVIVRPSAITGPDAPTYDIVHNIVSFSRTISAVPRLSSRVGFFDLVSREAVVAAMVSKLHAPVAPLAGVAAYVHMTGDSKSQIPATEIAQYVQKSAPEPVRTIDLKEWLKLAMENGLSEAVAYVVEVVDGWSRQEESVLLPLAYASEPLITS